MKRVGIIQSSYIPWKGYFDLIARVDDFVLYDDVPFSKHDWRNRNRVKTPAGAAWLSIPVLTRGRFGQPIREVRVADRRWAARHWKTIQTYYARAAHFKELAPALAALFARAGGEPWLHRVNELFIRAICDLLDIRTRITASMEYRLSGGRVERLVDLCAQLGAAEYLSGAAARSYLDEAAFAARGIAVRWMDYASYPDHRQLHTPPFVHEVTVLDLLLNEGVEGARRYMRALREPCSSPS